MSREYLIGEEKELIIEKIRYYFGLRMTDREIIDNLKNNEKVELSERTLRRYKQEIREKAGNNLDQIYSTEIISNIVNDICTYESLQRQSWNAYTKARTTTDQIRALSLVRNATGDKIKLLKNIPKKFYRSNFEYYKPEENTIQSLSNKTPKEIIKEAKAVMKDSDKSVESLQKLMQLGI